MPSLDLVIYKMGGKDGQWNPDLTRIPQPADNFGTHTNPPTPPKNGSYETYSIARILEMVCQATVR